MAQDRRSAGVRGLGDAPGPPRVSPPSDEHAAGDGPRRRAPASPAPPRRPGYAQANRLGSAHPRAEDTPTLGPSITTDHALSLMPSARVRHGDPVDLDVLAACRPGRT